MRIIICRIVYPPKLDNRTQVKFNYCLHGYVLESVDKAKYRGVTISEDLKWESHVIINNICGKANKTLDFLRHNLNIGFISVKKKGIHIISQTITRVCLFCMGSPS